ncbi:MAG: HEAT repeat domain-containing protein [Kaiparowitsia implicata GSE-PSE-MK54-09C]|jgi:HEAT repeat protein|nr:HEAT repeat domain-containing protein [Kaiparowitsia implicata GSE-PSE-MK54-09C]
MPQRLDELLQECTVKITVPGQDGWGTGFFVATGLILTCDHVVKRSPRQVQVGWQNKTLDAMVERFIPDPYDLALLRVTLAADVNPPCVWLDEEVQPRDPLYLFGYPDEGDRQGEPRTFNCDGITGSAIAAILFNLGQVRPGMSGSPLLNQRTGKVCGMVKFTRDRSSDMGGGAIPTRVVLAQFPELRSLQQEFHGGDLRWVSLITQPGIDFQHYLQAILTNEDYQEWQELYTPTTVEDRRRMPVQDTTTVSQRRFSSRLKLRVKTVKPDKEGQGNQLDGTPEQQEQVEQWDVLAGLRNYASEHVVLIGKPGSGKSTSLKRLLWEEAEKALHDPTARIPVLVKLRRCIGTIEGLIRDFLVGHQVAVETAHIEKLLSQGRLLLLLDGLNELPERFRTEIANFRDRYHSTTPMIVSTRDLSAGGTLGIAKTLKMLPLTEPQMREFVRGYLGDEGDRLFQQIQGDRLRKFAETPLLLWMLCRVFAEECIQAAKEKRTPKLPENLGLAFREFTQLYDHGADEHQAIQEDAPVDSRDQWPSLLRHLAFVMMQGKTLIDRELSVPREEAEDCLTAYLQQAGRANPRECAERWLTDLLKYHLIQPVIQPNFEEHIEFRHQLIQEYYAAEYILKLLPNLTDDQLKQDYLNYLKWTEPIALLLALVSDEGQALRVVRLAIEVDLMLGAKLVGKVNLRFQKQAVELVSDLKLPNWLKVKSLEAAQTDGVVPKLCEAIKSQDSHISRSAAEALAKLGSQVAISALKQAVEEVRPHEPFSIAAVVVDLGGNVLTEDLLRDLKDKDANVRKMVVQALDKLGDEVAIPDLITALREDGDPSVRFSASLALGRLGSEAAIPELLKGLEDEELHWEAERALQELGSEEAIPGLIKILDEHEDSDVRSRAVEVLGNLGGEEAISGLLKAFKDQDNHVLSRAERALEELKSETAIPELLKFLQDENLNVCRSAAHVLEALGNEEIIPELFKILKEELSHGLSNKIEEIFSLLVSLSNDAATPVLKEALNDESSYVRFIASLALAEIGNKDAIPELINALKDKNADVRLVAVKALGELGGKAAIITLTNALDDEKDDDVRLKIEQALAKKDGEAEPDDLTKDIHDEDLYLRRINGLEELDDDEAICLLINCLKDESNNMNYGMKIIALWSLRNLNREKVVSELLKAFQDDNHDLLLRAIESSDQIGDEIEIKLSEALDFDKSPDVRREAAEALGQMNNKAAIDWLLVALQYGHVKAGPALQNIKGDLAAYALPELLTLIPTSSGSPFSPGQDAFRALIAIQNHCQFYNYEILKNIIPQGNTISLYVSYAAADEVLQIQLANHLTLLERQGVITSWSSHQILPGDDRTQTIHQQLNTADIILLLISANSLADDTCYHLEIQRAMERHQSGEARVIPILLRPVDWQGAPFSQLDMLPKNHQPVTTWQNPDEAFLEIAEGIREIALELRRNAPRAGQLSDHNPKETPG